VPALMCRFLVSVGWDGALYDCDFNQMLDLPIASLAQRAQVSRSEPQASEDHQVGERRPSGVERRTIWNVDGLDELAQAPIAIDSHCFGCTAGSGSSCGGALA